MVHLRATRKVLRSLGPPVSSSDPPDTALGDWFVNRFVVARQPLLLLVSSASLLAILERMPCRVSRSTDETVWPDRRARELLGASGDEGR